MSARWLAELTVRGRVWRFTDGAAVDVEDRSGDLVRWESGLAPLTLAAGEEDVGLQITATDELPLEEIELADVRVWRWQVGTQLEAAALYLRGRARAAEHARVGDPVSFTVDLQPPAEERPILATSRRVDATTWPLTGSGAALLESQEGVGYPLIFGYPGYDGTSTPRPVVPVPLAQWLALDDAESQLAVSAEPIVCSLVFVGNPAGEVADAWQTVSQATDELGQRLMVADFQTTPASLPASADDQINFYAGFHPDWGGGRWRTAYDVICGLLRERAPDTVDWSRMPELELVLARYQVDSWINDPALLPWAWIRSVLLPLLPLVERQGQRGRYLELQRWRAHGGEVVRTLSADHGEAQRLSGRLFDSAGLVNELTVQYQRLSTGEWREQRTYSARQGIRAHDWAADDRVLGHPLAALSQSLYGPVLGAPLEVDWTWDEATALQIAHDRLERYALPRSTVTYQVRAPLDADELGIRAGDVVALTDAEIGWSEVPCVVAEPPLVGPQGVAVSLLLPPPDR